MSVIFLHSKSNRILKKPKMFSCYICSNTFTQMSNLRKHLRNIHRVQMNLRRKGTDYTCSVCSLTFSRKTNLKRHQIGIHKMKEHELDFSVRFLCNTCTAAFDDKTSLRIHRKNKHGEEDDKIDNPFECANCGELFQKKRELKKHLRSRHLSKTQNYELLKNILPSTTNSINIIWYAVENEEQNHFKTKFTMSVKNKSEIDKWISEFQYKNKITLRKRSIHKTVKSNIIYHVKYGCHHNTKPKAGSNVSAKHTKCPASITLKLFALSRDIRNYAEVRLIHIHNHVLDSLDVLKFREPVAEVKNKFRTMFLKGITPAQAIQQHKKDLEQQYGDEYQLILGDRGICPNKSWVYNYRTTCFKNKYEESDDNHSTLNESNDLDIRLDEEYKDKVSPNIKEKSPSLEVINITECSLLPKHIDDDDFPLRNDRNVNLNVRNIVHIPYPGDISDVKINNSKMVFTTVPTLQKINSKTIRNTARIPISRVTDSKISSSDFSNSCSQINGNAESISLNTIEKNSNEIVISEKDISYDDSSLIEIDDICMMDIPKSENVIYCSDVFVSPGGSEEQIMSVSSSIMEENSYNNESQEENIFLQFDEMNEIIKKKALKDTLLLRGMQQMVLNFHQNLKDSNLLNAALFRFGKN